MMFPNVVRVAKVLARFRSDPPPRLPRDRKGLVAALEEALGERSAQQHRRAVGRRWAKIVSVAAAAALVALIARSTLWSGGASPSRGPSGAPVAHGLTVLGAPVEVSPSANRAPRAATVSGNGADGLPVTGGMTLQTGIHLVAPREEEVRIGSEDGTVLTLEGGSELVVVEQSSTRRFSLRRGAVRAQVAKLHGGERFLIATDDAEVEVHGTVFRVSTEAGDPACARGNRTRVSVFEGVVSVRARGPQGPGTTASVASGGVWPPGCERREPQGRGPQTGAPQTGSEAAPARAARSGKRSELVAAATAGSSSRRGAEPSGRPASHLAPAPFAETRADAPAPTPGATENAGLAAANDLFAAALRAKRQHRFGEAIRLFSRLATSFPDGPLTEGALVQRLRLLEATDPPAAAHAAAAYLAQFPTGYAGDEARRLVMVVPPP